MSPAWPILTDADLERDLARTLDLVMAGIRDALLSHAEGALEAPPRFSVDAGRGRLVFTVGAERARTRAMGFRVYETFPESTPEHGQIVAVFDAADGRLLGLVLGNLLGALRTAALNAVAIERLARGDARTLGVLGTGFQARWHTLFALRVRPFARVLIYSRRPKNRAAFVRWLSAHTDRPVVEKTRAEPVVREADVLLEVTNARAPVFDAAWLPPGVHINAVGPKLQSGHAFPVKAALDADLLASDAPAQLSAYEGYFLPEAAQGRVVPLSALVAGRHTGRTAPEERTVFLSAGLAGTEPAAARYLLDGLG
ncbi:ornithine cyclodeaminase family protein [Oceanithermus desulfurans]|uniref:Delta(1)-pyrroline-2-carboxylate reductase n=2 Tax=Oceanithermus desulfurans TaxID=227924 RepID=A0A511RLU1_9DEIN|nr:ornithine cyclodeaminase family protein [Oceanithermus desulfurans]MBB6029432.1 ornithine cyclodeaminase/alanine dehydrogenase-like protein (mu-crystallin family) [Oceanithermus desulfurans]GEM89912.1 delta(1)-pyrroline-2-carboxylate reductase [Oceanithermus desulfurans NBRC 100063]